MSIKKFLYTIDVKKVLEDNNIFLEADNKNIIQKDKYRQLKRENVSQTTP